jgi:hypothetical protein
MMAPASSFSALVPELRAVAARQRGVDGRAEIHCAGCGYGAVVARLPDRCPMCGSTDWRTPSAGRDLGGFTVEVDAVMAGDLVGRLQ